MTAPETPAPWILTHTGKKISLLRPKPASIDLEDIAWSLSQINRFTGHTCRPYSVAEHSIRTQVLSASYDQPLDIQRLVLLHDAAEAYLGDTSYPLKTILPGLHDIEENMVLAIYRAFHILPPNPDEHAKIKIFDRIMGLTEAEALLAADTTDWPWRTDGAVPDRDVARQILLSNQSAGYWHESFLYAFNTLTHALEIGDSDADSSLDR